MAITGNPGDLATGGFGTGSSGLAATSRDLANAVARQESMAAARQVGQGSNIGGGFRGPIGTWGSPGSIVPGSMLARIAASPLSPYRGAFNVTQDELIRAAIANASLLGTDPMNPSLFQLKEMAAKVQESPELQGILGSVYGPFLEGASPSVPADILSNAIKEALPSPKPVASNTPTTPSFPSAPFNRAIPPRQTPASAEIDPFSMSNLLAGPNDVMRYTSPVAQGVVKDMPGALRPLTTASGEVIPGGRLHAGMDFEAPTGTPVTPSMPGTVVQVSEGSGYGPFIDIQDINGQIQRYAVHNTGTVNVSEGDYVAPGDIIGTVGAQGIGPKYFQHLHFENISPQDAAYNEIMRSYETGAPGFAGRTSTPAGSPIRSSTQALADQMGLTTGVNVAGLLPNIPYTLLGGRPNVVASAEMPSDVVPEDIVPIPPTSPRQPPAPPVVQGPMVPFERGPVIYPPIMQQPTLVADAMPAPEYADPTATLTLPSGLLGPAPYDVVRRGPVNIIPSPSPAPTIPVLRVADTPAAPVVAETPAATRAPAVPGLPPRTPTPTALDRFFANLFGGAPSTSRGEMANTLLASAGAQDRSGKEKDKQERKPEDEVNTPTETKPVQISQTLLPDWYWEWYKSRGLTGGLLG